jgi:hypothetical protein
MSHIVVEGRRMLDRKPSLAPAVLARMSRRDLLGFAAKGAASVIDLGVKVG